MNAFSTKISKVDAYTAFMRMFIYLYEFTVIENRKSILITVKCMTNLKKE